MTIYNDDLGAVLQGLLDARDILGGELSEAKGMLIETDLAAYLAENYPPTTETDETLLRRIRLLKSLAGTRCNIDLVVDVFRCDFDRAARLLFLSESV